MIRETGEQELLAMIRSGDPAAFEELHRRYYKQLFQMAVRKLGDENEAYDLLQDMFLEIWNKRESFSISNPLQNYLKNRLWFKLSGHFRTRDLHDKHLRNFSEFLRQDQSNTYIDETELKEVELQYEMIMEVINRTIAAMPDKMREVFILSRSKEYTIAEIAQKLGVSPKTVKNQINNAMNRIRQATDTPGLTAFQLLVLLWLMNP